MTPLQLCCLQPVARSAQGVLEAIGFTVSHIEAPSEGGIVAVQAATGSQIADQMALWELSPARVVAICPQAEGLPSGCLWLPAEVLESPRGQNLLRAWLTDAKDDPVQGLLAQISHDMRSPLSVISTAASLIPRFSDDPVKIRRYLSLINESSSVLKSLVNDILDYSNIRQGEFAFTTLDFNLPQLLQSVTDSFRLLVKNPEQLRVDWEAGPGLPESVHGDPGRLRQVLTNLLNNALKFTARGQVKLLATPFEGKLRFEIQDSGVGIRPEALERIFLPYQQADASVHSNYGGTGLGLTICRALSERMGGQIGVSSTFGEGSVFWFTADLPAVTLDQPLALPELRGRKILVGSANASLFTSSLSAHNTLVVSRTTREVEENLVADGFDLHIIDLELGQFDLVAKATRSDSKASVVVITSAGQRGDVATCKELGVSGYLTTPIEPRELEVALALALSANSQDVVTKYTAKELLAAAGG